MTRHAPPVYIDGPHHDYSDRAARDRDQEQAMLALGYRTIRFHHGDNWAQIIADHPEVFGTGPSLKPDSRLNTPCPHFEARKGTAMEPEKNTPPPEETRPKQPTSWRIIKEVFDPIWFIIAVLGGVGAGIGIWHLGKKWPMGAMSIGVTAATVVVGAAFVVCVFLGQRGQKEDDPDEDTKWLGATALTHSVVGGATLFFAMVYHLLLLPDSSNVDWRPLLSWVGGIVIGCCVLLIGGVFQMAYHFMKNIYPINLDTPDEGG